MVTLYPTAISHPILLAPNTDRKIDLTTSLKTVISNAEHYIHTYIYIFIVNKNVNNDQEITLRLEKMCFSGNNKEF